MENGNVVAIFEHSILTVRFLENAKIDVDDIKEIYDYADKWANGQPYCVMFNAMHHYTVTEDAAEYMSHGNPSDAHVLAKAYVISTKESQIKVKAHLAFDHPDLV
ncbi:MAG TPA: hypothetical protein VNZ45_13190, partial [Bacteroidia bacterium]|nr:hypothetical protein [Bacteroidia bacterium]